MEEFVFNEVREEHLPIIDGIINYYVDTSSAVFQINKFTLEEVRDIVIFKVPQYKTFVIERADNPGLILGYVTLMQHKKREAYDITAEVAIYFKPEFVGKGIGKVALNFIENVAKEKGFHCLVSTICGENERSIKLFENCGYVRCAHYKEVAYKFGRYLDLIALQKII